MVVASSREVPGRRQIDNREGVICMKRKEGLVFPKSYGVTNKTVEKLKKIAVRMKLTPSGAFRKLVDERAARWKINAE